MAKSNRLLELTLIGKKNYCARLITWRNLEKVRTYLYESPLEIVSVDYFRALGYEHIHGPVIAPFNEQVNLNVHQNRHLASLRGTVLPNLLTAVIELPEAEAIAEEAS